MQFLDFILARAERVGIFLTFLGGGIAWVWAQWRQERKDRAAQKGGVLEKELAYTDRVEKRNEMLLADHERLLKELLRAREQLAGNHIPPEEILRSIVRADELGLIWVKERVAEFDFVMVAVSPRYARDLLGGPPEIYDGRRDADIWPHDVAATFAANDEATHKMQETIAVKERVEGGGTNAAGMFVGRKFPVRIGARDFIMGIGELILDGEERPSPDWETGFKGEGARV